MSEKIAGLFEVYNTFSEGSIVVILFVIALLVSIFVKNDKKYRVAVFVPNIVFLFVLFNPIIMSKLVSVGGLARVARVFWILQITLVFAYVATALIEKPNKKVLKFMFAGAAVVCIVVFGKYMFTNSNFSLSENPYKVPDEVIEVCEIIENDGNQGIVIPDYENVEYYRQYDGKLWLAFGRSTEAPKGLAKEMAMDTYDLDKILDGAYENARKYVILNKNHGVSDKPSKYGLVFLGETEDCLIYKIG